MKHLKHVGELYVLDWKRIFKNPLTIFLVVALMILPSLYAWFNIKALWDPYGNTKEIPIAIYSDDTGAELNGKKVEIGQEVIENLHENDQLGWVFVDSKDALTQGVKSGKYYAGIYLPDDFSDDLLSFTTGEIKKPTIDYYFNEKINAIAPKITDKGASSLKEKISENFIHTASSTLLTAFNEVGYDIESNLLSINKLKNLILEVDDNADQIEAYTQEVLDFQKKLPELKEKLAKADEFASYLPEVDEMGQKIVALNQKMPEIEEQAKIILTLQESIPEIQNAGEQLAMVDQDFDQISETLTEGISEAKQGLAVIQEVQGLLPQVQQFGADASEFAAGTKEAAEKLDANLDTITNVAQVNINLLVTVSDTLNQFAETLNGILSQTDDLTPEQRGEIKQVLLEVSDSLGRLQTMQNDLIAWFQQLENQLGGDFSSVIDRIAQARDLAASVQNLATTLAAGVDTISKADIQAFLQQLAALTSNLSAIGKDIDVDAVSQKVRTLLENKLIPALTNAQGLLDQANQIDFDALLSATQKTISNAITLLEKYEKELPAIGQEIHDGNVLLNGHMDEIVAGINKGADLYQNELPILSSKLAIASDFIEYEWPELNQELTSTLATIDEKLPQVETAVNTASELIQEDWPSLKNGIHKAATAIRKGEEIADLEDIIMLLKNDVEAESDFFTEPVELKTTTMYPIENNGSASTPFYTALCLWVGALLLSSIAVTEFHLEGEDKKRYTSRETFFARMATFLTIATAQALIVTLGNYFALGVDVRQPVYSVLFALLVGLTFMMIIYVLVSLFGNIGKGLGIILLVLSISGGGGNYPIQVSGKFFQFINPLLPFTHAVNLLRESAGGIYWPNTIKDILILVSLFILFGMIGALCAPYSGKPLQKMKELTEESHFFH